MFMSYSQKRQAHVSTVNRMIGSLETKLSKIRNPNEKCWMLNRFFVLCMQILESIQQQQFVWRSVVDYVVHVRWICDEISCS